MFQEVSESSLSCVQQFVDKCILNSFYVRKCVCENIQQFIVHLYTYYNSRQLCS